MSRDLSDASSLAERVRNLPDVHARCTRISWCERGCATLDVHTVGAQEQARVEVGATYGY
jgi:hypothetical protein